MLGIVHISYSGLPLKPSLQDHMPSQYGANPTGSGKPQDKEQGVEPNNRQANLLKTLSLRPIRRLSAGLKHTLGSELSSTSKVSECSRGRLQESSPPDKAKSREVAFVTANKLSRFHLHACVRDDTASWS